MKTKLASLIALGIIAATPAFAQEATPQSLFIDAQNEDQYLAKDLLIGAKVQDENGKIIGDIEDLVLNDWNRVEGVVMGTGGFLGVAEKKVGVKLSALKFVEKNGKTIFEFSTGGKRNIVVTVGEPCGDRIKELLKRFS